MAMLRECFKMNSNINFVLMVVMLSLKVKCGSNPYENLINAIYDSYNSNVSFHENFYSILNDICRTPVYCVNGSIDDGLIQMSNRDDFYQPFTHGTDLDKINKAREKLWYYRTLLMGCCKVCSCDRICVNRDNCCPMYNRTSRFKPRTIKDDTKTIKTTCELASLSTYKLHSTDGGLDNAYHMVTDCFLRLDDLNITEKCRHPNIARYDEITPVYSNDTGFIYRNQYCAKCNNNVKYISWYLIPSFGDIFTLTEGLYFLIPSTPEETFKILQTRSKVIELFFFPPEDVVAQSLDNSCQKTKAGYVDPPCSLMESAEIRRFFQTACDFSDFQFYPLLATSYWNVFCYLCHRINPIEKQEDCKSNRKSLLTTLTAILKFPTADNQPSTVDKSNAKCHCHEYLDIRNDTCRKSFCPSGSFRVGCECKKFLTNFTGLTIKIHLDAYPMMMTSDDFARLNATQFTFNLRNAITTFFKRRWKPIQISHQFLYSSHSKAIKESWILHYTLLIKFLFTFEIGELVESMYGILRSGITVRVMGEDLYLTLGFILRYKQFSIDTEAIDPDREFKKVFTFHKRTDSVKDMLSFQILSKIIICTRVQLEEDEIEIMKNISKLFGYPGNTFGYIFMQKDRSICVEDFEMMFIRNSGVIEDLYQSMVFVIFTLFVTILASGSRWPFP